MTPEAAHAADAVAAGRAPASEKKHVLAWALLPLLLLSLLLALFVASGPAQLVQGEGVPPVERLTFGRVELTSGEIVLSVLNDGPDPVTIAQVAIDDAFWTHRVEPTPTLGHLGRARVVIPYPWVTGEAHAIKLLTSTGATFEHVIPVAVATPRVDARALAAFALIGVYVGVVPVAIGLFWYPFMRQLSRPGLDFLMALTLGLLAFLFVDGAHEGLEAAALVPGSLQGTALFVFGAAAAWLLLDWVGARLAGRRRSMQQSGGARPHAVALAVLIAVGIGLHNFGEGLAIGSAFALGELALGSLLIVGFMLHNTTEGLAIVAPLARETAAPDAARPSLGLLAKLGAIGGVPTILGAWAGGFLYAPALAVLMLAFGVGAIGQVIAQILRHSLGERSLRTYASEGAVLAGLAAGVLVMYVTGAIVG